MIIPNFSNIKVVDEKGYFTPDWQNLMQELFSTLQKNLSNEGIIVPQQDAANILSLNSGASIGALLYDSDNDLLKVNLAGTFKTVTTA